GRLTMRWTRRSGAVAERPMVRHYLQSRLSLALLLAFTCTWLACGSSLKTQAPVVAPVAPAIARAAEPPIVQPAPPVQAPGLALIADSDRHFKAGETELGLGHPDAARQEFDRSIEVLLESPYGGRTEPRIREHFDRLVDRISTYEVKALAEGDGFTEKKY